MAEPTLRYKVEGGIARITLCRPALLNRMDMEAHDEFEEALYQVHLDPTVRVVLIEGEGKHFSAGSDVNWFKILATASEYDRLAAARMSTGAMRKLAQMLGGAGRVAIIAGSGVGKSVLMGQMIAGAEADIVVTGLIGERGRGEQRGGGEAQKGFHGVLSLSGVVYSALIVGCTKSPLSLNGN